MDKGRADEITSVFYSFWRRLRQELSTGSPLLEFTMPQLEALRYIGEQGQVSMRALADFLSVAPPSATSLTNHLEELGFVVRQRDEASRRSVKLSLTKVGSGVLARAVRERSSKMKILLGSLSIQEQHGLLELFKKMSQKN